MANAQEGPVDLALPEDDVRVDAQEGPDDLVLPDAAPSVRGGKKRTAREEKESDTTTSPQRVTRSKVAVQSYIKQEDLVDGNIQCPQCRNIICVGEKGCNVVACRNHSPQFLYFCLLCKEICLSEYSTCPCPKRNTKQTRSQAKLKRAEEMEEHNRMAQENPIEILDDDDNDVDEKEKELGDEDSDDQEGEGEKDDDDDDEEDGGSESGAKYLSLSSSDDEKSDNEDKQKRAEEMEEPNRMAQENPIETLDDDDNDVEEEDEKDNGDSDNDDDDDAVPTALLKKNVKKRDPTTSTYEPRQAMDSGERNFICQILEKVQFLETAGEKELKALRAVSRVFKTWVDGELDRRIHQDILPACPVNAATVDDVYGITMNTLNVGRGETDFNSSERLIQYAMTFANPEVFNDGDGWRFIGYDSDDEDDINFYELSINKERAEECLRGTGKVDLVDFIDHNNGEALAGDEKGLDWRMVISEPEGISASQFIQHSEELVKEWFDGHDLEDATPGIGGKIWMLLCRSKPSSFRRSYFSCQCAKIDGYIKSTHVFHFSTVGCGDFHVEFNRIYIGSF